MKLKWNLAQIRCATSLTLAVLIALTVTDFPACASGSTGRSSDDQPERLTRLGAKIQPSIVTIGITDRLGHEISVGTGFAAVKPGWIVTNLHVIGEGRSFIVKDYEGKRLNVTHVISSDRHVDLAVLMVEEKHLKPLQFADFTKIRKGQPFVAIGHPQGLSNSLVQGIISSRRVIDGLQMLQVAMPVESGNSGGPLVNLDGKVLGVVTLKSLATDNIGFAIGCDQVQKLIDRPNPIPISRWMTIGILNPETWEPRLGASWRQKGGHIMAHSSGDGFGGRAICVYKKPVPGIPHEISVEVRLGDESGAAGLAFRIDEQNRHYGFYPSNGQIRFSRFEGDTPFQWTVVKEIASNAYRPKKWNQLKVRVEDKRAIVFVNQTRIGEFPTNAIRGQGVGLAKFRDTRAEFRNFRIGKTLTEPALPPGLQEKIAAELKKPIDNPVFEKLVQLSKENPGPSRKLILDDIDRLHGKIERLKQLAMSMHIQECKQGFARIVDQKSDQQIDLIKACLWIARLDDPDQDIPGYHEYFESLAEQLEKQVDSSWPVEKKIEQLNQFLFAQQGFHGSRHEYYRPENSYLSSVLEDREGIPITLSILYIELGKRIGLSLDGIGLPGHFVVSLNRKDQPPQLIDPFDDGKMLSVEDAKFIVASTTTRSWDENYLSPVSKRRILFRVLLNLRGIAENNRDQQAIFRYLELMHVLEPDDISIRGTRAVLLFQQGFQQKALGELDKIIAERPTGLDLQMLQRMRNRLRAQMERDREQTKNSN